MYVKSLKLCILTTVLKHWCFSCTFKLLLLHPLLTLKNSTYVWLEIDEDFKTFSSFALRLSYIEFMSTSFPFPRTSLVQNVTTFSEGRRFIWNHSFSTFNEISFTNYIHTNLIRNFSVREWKENSKSFL